MTNVQRRKVIQAASLAGVSIFGGHSVAHATDYEQRTYFDRRFEVIVVGSGFAGLAAALSAAEKGAKVLVVEKMNFIGGNSIMSGGMMAIPGHPLQKEQKIDDSPRILMQDMLRVGQKLNHPDLVRDLVDRAYATWQWTESLGVQWGTKLSGKGGHSRARCLIPVGGGEAIIKALLQKCKEFKVRIRTKSPVEQLLYHRSEGVYGVQVRFGEETKRIRSTKGVILAYGGFGADTVYRAQCNPTMRPDLPTTNQPGATSEMWRETARIGARQIQNDWIQCLPNCSPKEEGIGFASSFASVAAGQYGIWVHSKTGHRFVNEFGDRFVTTNGILSVLEDGAQALALADRQGVRVLRSTQPGVLQKCMETGALLRYETLDRVAIAYGIPKKELQKTVARWNRAIRKGKDGQWGRKFAKNLQPLTKGPFYVSRMTPKVHHCMGGLLTNPQGEVLSVINDDPIYGLFAAGECTGGIHGAVRIGACAVLDCLANGRKVGQAIML